MNTEENLKNVAPNIKYEFDMLDWSYEKLINSTMPVFERNSYIECFLIHARNLVDFFIKAHSSKGDCVLARHFFSEPSEWESQEVNLCEFVRRERSSINKKLAHLTFDRINSKSWEFNKLYNELKIAQNLFLSRLNADQRSWF